MKVWLNATSARKRIVSAFRDERGAVTIDWVVISAAVIVFGLLVWSIVEGGVIEGSSQIRQSVLSASNY